MVSKLRCRVCERPAWGTHYGILSCEGCKAFFKRSASRCLAFACLSGDGSCETEANLGIRCRACRLHKCLELGMRLQDLRRLVRSDTKQMRKALAAKDKTNGSSRDLKIKSRKALLRNLKPKVMACAVNEFPAFSETSILEITDESRYDSFPADGYSAVGQTTRTPNLFEDSMSYPLYALQNAVKDIFGDQIERWTSFKERPTIRTHRDLTEEKFTNLVDIHHCDFTERIHLFARTLAGFADLDSRAQRGIWSLWKVSVYAMIHHGPFLTENESYLTFGEEEIQYSRYWQERITYRSIMPFVYSFCTQLRNLDLGEVERYLLLAVVLLEPEDKDSSQSEDSPQLDRLHRFYIKLLLRLVQQRCKTATEISCIYLKLSRFFGAFRDVQSLVRAYMSAPPISTTRCFAKIVSLQQDNRIHF